MLVRVFQFVLGVALAAGGGWLGWTYRGTFGSLFPPGEAGIPWVLLAAIFGVTTGLVFLVSAVHPRPNQRRARAEKEAREEEALQRAEAYYSERARAADRDWRSADITPLPDPSPRPEPAPQPVAAAPVLEPAPAPEPAAATPPPPPPPPPPAAPPLFPAEATLAAIPRAQQPPPPAPKPVPVSVPVKPAEGQSHPAIREALANGNLEEAGKLLEAARDIAKGMDLAELTALAGDHAHASGQTGHARWLWKVALKRFGELDAMDSPMAKAVTENLKSVG